MTEFETQLVKLSHRIYDEHIEIVKKITRLNSKGSDLLCREIAIHQFVVYNKSIELARCILNELNNSRGKI